MADPHTTHSGPVRSPTPLSSVRWPPAVVPAPVLLRERDHPLFNALVNAVFEVRLAATFIQQILDSPVLDRRFIPLKGIATEAHHLTGL